MDRHHKEGIFTEADIDAKDCIEKMSTLFEDELKDYFTHVLKDGNPYIDLENKIDERLLKVLYHYCFKLMETKLN